MTMVMVIIIIIIIEIILRTVGARLRSESLPIRPGRFELYPVE